MARPKGSKNRATLEREAREREAKEREEKEKERETTECKNIDKQSTKLHPGADVESDPSVYLGEGENGSERTLEGIMEVGGEMEDKRGDKSDSNSNSNSNAKSKVRLKKSSLPQCERCGAEIPCDPLKLDTNLLTGKADYHRESRRYVRLCNKCSCELSELVDRWLWDRRKGGNPELRKFPLGDRG